MDGLAWISLLDDEEFTSLQTLLEDIEQSEKETKNNKPNR